MKILLIGNYRLSEQESMQRFAELVLRMLKAAGHEAKLLSPAPLLGKLKPGPSGLGKWLGYADRFLLFLPRLKREAAWADVIHICDQGNAVYVPRIWAKPHIVTCHDLLAIKSAAGAVAVNPTSRTGRVFQRWILSGLRKAQRVVCDSEQTRRELLEVGALPADRTVVVPIALNYPYRPMALGERRAQLRSLGLGESIPFFLHVGGNQWYKNRMGVVRIFAHLAALSGFARHHLLMVGKPWTREIREAVVEGGLETRVQELVGVSNEDLRALYSAADALVFPSLQEGFGWPIVEAQACGCAVFTTNRAPMTEVGGDAAVYFDPEDPAGAAQVIAEGVADVGAIRRRGLENAKRFSSEAMAAGYIAAIEQVVKDRESAGRVSGRGPR